ncbi:hypothetical protein A7975_23740 [Bacillus sp. FJAT-26390]|nr:hypothetical protein A7975_23740 [Bacillus sp. FJAT-26390]
MKRSFFMDIVFTLVLLVLSLIGFFFFIRFIVQKRLAPTFISGGLVLLFLMIFTFLFIDQYIIGVIV